MTRIDVYPNRLKQFGNPNNNNFVLITNTELIKCFNIVTENCTYTSCFKIAYDETDDFINKLKNIPQNSHVLIISPNCLIHSIEPGLIGKRKLLIFACNSAPTTIPAIEHFLRCGEKTDPVEQENFANYFFEQGQSSKYLKFIDNEYKTIATFNHLSEDYGWHEQSGLVQWGQQQVFPSGEIACFLVPLKAEKINFDIRFSINGTVALKGYSVVHSGTPSFLLKDQERIYQQLSTIKKYPIIIEIRNGEIIEIKPTHDECKPASQILEQIFTIDSRFRIIYEVGFALNHHVIPYPANSAMNEVSANKTGTLHFGIGMLPFTQYHIDIVCPQITVFDSNENFFFGHKFNNNKNRMNRIKSSQCPCIE